jgi:nickel-type superoxide dismutase maturation protease
MRRPLLCALAAPAAVVLALLVLVCARLALKRFVVQDTSMRPALEPSDRLLIVRGLRPRRGDVVVAQDPERHSIHVVKRVASVEPNGSVTLLADNPNVSRDSRHFGAVSRRLLVGRAVYRYLPAERRGWLASRQ